jgi:hypothetical protein
MKERKLQPSVGWRKREVSTKPFYAALIASAGVLGLTSLLVHPSGTVKTYTSSKRLLAGSEVDPGVLHIMEKSCQNCHSERTEWPWYSYVAPMSWLIEKDVCQGRSHLNLSRWDEYDLPNQRQILAEMAVVLRNRQMPLPRYTLLHPGAKPSEREYDQIYQWVKAERLRLRSLALAGSAAVTSDGAGR